MSPKRSAKGAVHYSRGLLAPWYTPANKFVVVTVGRSGSELLVELLNSHPRIKCDGELLVGFPRFPRAYVRAATVRAGLAGAEVYGWKMLVHQMRPPRHFHHAERYVADLWGRGWKVLLLERRDHLRQAISMHRGFATELHPRRGSASGFEPIEIDPTQLLETTETTADHAEWLRGVVGDTPHLRLVYEDDLLEPDDHDATVARVCRYLGVTPAPTSTDLIRVAPRSTADMVSNWDAVAEHFAGTRFAHFLAPDAACTETS